MKLFKNLKNTFEQIQNEIGHIISVVTLSVHIFYKSYYKYVCIFSTVTLNYCEKEQILHYQMTVIRSGWCFQIQTIWNTFCKNLHTSSYVLRKKKSDLPEKGQTDRNSTIYKSYTHRSDKMYHTKCVLLVCCLTQKPPMVLFQKENLLCYHQLLSILFSVSSEWQKGCTTRLKQKVFSASWFRSYAIFPFRSICWISPKKQDLLLHQLLKSQESVLKGGDERGPL